MFSYLATEIQGGNCFAVLRHLAGPTVPGGNLFFWLKVHAHCKETGTFRGIKKSKLLTVLSSRNNHC